MFSISDDMSLVSVSVMEHIELCSLPGHRSQGMLRSRTCCNLSFYIILDNPRQHLPSTTTLDGVCHLGRIWTVTLELSRRACSFFGWEKWQDSIHLGCLSIVSSETRLTPRISFWIDLLDRSDGQFVGTHGRSDGQFVGTHGRSDGQFVGIHGRSDGQCVGTHGRSDGQWVGTYDRSDGQYIGTYGRSDGQCVPVRSLSGTIEEYVLDHGGGILPHSMDNHRPRSKGNVEKYRLIEVLLLPRTIETFSFWTRCLSSFKERDNTLTHHLWQVEDCYRWWKWGCNCEDEHFEVIWQIEFSTWQCRRSRFHSPSFRTKQTMILLCSFPFSKDANEIGQCHLEV